MSSIMAVWVGRKERDLTAGDSLSSKMAVLSWLLSPHE